MIQLLQIVIQPEADWCENIVLVTTASSEPAWGRFEFSGADSLPDIVTETATRNVIISPFPNSSVLPLAPVEPPV